MKFLLRIAFIFAANALGFYLCSRYIDGFHIARLPSSFLSPLEDWKPLLLITLIFAILNIFVKPVLKLILSPVIILTLGLGLILVNAAILYFLTIFSKDITIDNVAALLLASVAMGIMGFFSSRLTK